jgi:hypothetical protein
VKRPELVLLAPLFGIAAWIAAQANAVQEEVINGPPPVTMSSAAANGETESNSGATNTLAFRTDPGDATIRAGHDAAPLRDVADIRRRLIEGQSGTYIADILVDRDSALARWPERVANPLKVWVQAGTALPDWNPLFVGQVNDAFITWQNTGVPVNFTFVHDSTDADVHVTWLDHFDEQISGKTMWARDENYWIVDGNIVIALHHNHGEALDASAIRAIALHEVGHLLGLDHTADTMNIMTPRVRVRDLSAGDRATMKLLYSLPPGSVR